MDQKNIRRLLDLVSRPPLIPKNTHLPEDVSKNTLFFSFKFLYLHYDGFKCCDPSYHKNGDSLIKIVETLIDYSKNNRYSIEDREHCHDVNVQKLVDKKLEALATKFSGKQFFQFGLEGSKERLIGFFDNQNTHLFEVCLLDLNHDIFPMKPKRVFP